MRELLASGASAVCVSLPPDGPVAGVPKQALADAERLGVPLIDLPWEVAFADVNRWVIDEVIQRRAPDSFARALLAGEGMDGIAAALEVALEQASVAVAMEGLRRRSAADERAREDVLWLLVTGAAGPTDRIVARATLLGFDRAPYELAVARADEDLDRLARELRDRAPRAALELVIGVRARRGLRGRPGAGPVAGECAPPRGPSRWFDRAGT